MWICPVCGSKEVGKISTLYYFCSNCFKEYNLKLETFNISEEGVLLKIAGGDSN